MWENRFNNSNINPTFTAWLKETQPNPSALFLPWWKNRKSVLLPYRNGSTEKKPSLIFILQRKRRRHRQILQKFQNCTFQHQTFSECKFRSSQLSDVRFENCDLSNISFAESSLYRVEFISCKLLGTNLSETTMNHVLLHDCNAGYINLAMSKMNQVRFAHSQLRNGSLNDCRFHPSHLRVAIS